MHGLFVKSFNLIIFLFSHSKSETQKKTACANEKKEGVSIKELLAASVCHMVQLKWIEQ